MFFVLRSLELVLKNWHYKSEYLIIIIIIFIIIVLLLLLLLLLLFVINIIIAMVVHTTWTMVFNVCFRDALSKYSASDGTDPEGVNKDRSQQVTDMTDTQAAKDQGGWSPPWTVMAGWCVC